MASGVDGPSGPRAPGVGAVPVGAVDGTRQVAAAFEAVLGQADVSGAERAAPLSPMAQLKAGTIDVDKFRELTVRDATRHLEGALSAPDLELVRAELRNALESDPDLEALVQTARVGR